MKKTLFNNNWRVRERGMGFSQFKKIGYTDVTLPHDGTIQKERTAEAPSGANSGYYTDCAFEYKKNFKLSDNLKKKKVMLEFDGAYMNAEVSINRNLIVRQPFGYNGFMADLTDYLHFDKDNVIDVSINASAPNHSRSYAGAGISRDVYLLVSELIYIKPWSLTAITEKIDKNSAQINLTVEIRNEMGDNEEGTVEFTVFNSEHEEVLNFEENVRLKDHASISVKKNIPDPMLWDIDHPELYQLRCRVLKEGHEMDSDIIEFGIRTVSIDLEKGLLLNGKQIKLAGGCVHSDNGPLGMMSNASIEERKIKILKDSGFNALRTAHNPASTAFLRACDKYGVLVMEEAFDCWNMGKLPNDYHLYFDKWWKHDIRTMIERDINHPCIIMWSIGNEVYENGNLSNGHKLCKDIADFVRAIDSSRPVTQGVMGMAQTEVDDLTDTFSDTNIAENLAGMSFDPNKDMWGPATEAFFKPLDLAGYNYMAERYEHDLEQYPNRIMYGSETFGGKSFYDYWKLVKRHNRVVGDFIWTAYDYIGEVGVGSCKIAPQGESLTMETGFGAAYPEFTTGSGNLDICLTRLPQNYYRTAILGLNEKPYIAVVPPELSDKNVVYLPWGWEPVVHSWSFPGNEGMLTRIEVYSDAEEVELLVNGKSYGRKSVGEENRYYALFEQIIYQPGEITAIAYIGGEENSRETLRTALEPVRLLAAPDKTVLSANGREMSFITVEAVDVNGIIVPYYNGTVRCKVSGAAKRTALGNGDSKSIENFYKDSYQMYRGKMLAIVEAVSCGKHAEVCLEADGLESASVGLTIVS